MNDSATLSADPVLGPADSPRAPGTRLGSVELRGVVSRGASGIVYRGWDHDLALPVAVKEYLPQALLRRGADGDVQAVDDAAATAFARGLHAFVDEARVLARCDHPCLLRVTRLVRSGGTACRVMPWVDGETLLAVRRGMKGPPDGAALESLVEDLLGAVEAYQRAGGVHGAVDPEHVMLRDDDRPLLLGPRVARTGPLAAPGVDFQAIAALARFCIDGQWPPAAAGAAEPLPALAIRLGHEHPRARYRDSLLRTLDAVASGAAGEGPRSAAEFREWLACGPGGSESDLILRVVESARAGAAGPEVAETPVIAAHSELPALHDAGETALPEPALDGPAVPPPPAAARTTSAPARRADARRRSAGALGVLVAAGLLAFGGDAAWRAYRETRHAEPLAALAAESAVPAKARPLAVSTPVPAPVPVPTPEPAPAAVLPPAAVAEPAAPPSATTPPAAPAPRPPPPRAPAALRTAAAASPRLACGARSEFSLYRCMQQQCRSPQWLNHPQCLRLKTSDHVD